MSAAIVTLPLLWTPRPWDARVTAVCAGWLGTRYGKGQQAKGRFVDCIRFLAGSMDELYGWVRERFDRLPADMSLHDRDGAIAAMRRFLRLYEPNDALEPQADGSWRVESGDVLIVGPASGGPGHAMIAGGQQSELWHVEACGVVRTGCGIHGDLHGIFRVLDKELWLR